LIGRHDLALTGFGISPEPPEPGSERQEIYTRNGGGLPLIGNVGLVVGLRVLSVVPYWPHG
jgi:hypothetical protein